VAVAEWFGDIAILCRGIRCGGSHDRVQRSL